MPHDADLTLPSLVASLPGRRREQALALTVVFHPDTSRIGEVAVMPDGEGAWSVGRHAPAFGRPGAAGGKGLEEPHVSRSALQLGWRGSLLEIRRAGASRCRLAGRELEDMAQLDRDQLGGGIPIVLGHAVVLLLRLGGLPGPGLPDAPGGESLKGSGAYMTSLREEIARAAASDLDVLIRGETGTGKELVANAIHRGSRRSGAPMVSVNMAAIPPGLAAAALFGSARGAFTGADRAGEGYFMLARGGTLFLDEVGDTPAEVQPQLLRALQQREIQSVGGPVRRIDLRVISATDAALEGPDSDFKAALRHRLGACEILLPPLWEHREDIGEMLWYHLCVAAAELDRVPVLPGESSAPAEIGAWAELFHRFLCYRWPGNARELANFARQVVLASDTALSVPDPVAMALGRDGHRDGGVLESEHHPRRRMQDVDAQAFEQALRDNYYEPKSTARQLGVSRQSVYRRMEETPGCRLASRVSAEELSQALARAGGDVDKASLDLEVSRSGLRARIRELRRKQSAQDN